MEKVYDVIGVESPIMDFAVSIDRLPKTDSMSVMHDYLWQSGGKRLFRHCGAGPSGGEVRYAGSGGYRRIRYILP